MDHLCESPNGMMHPLKNMPDHGREITNIVSTVPLMLLLDDPEKKHEKLLPRFVPLGAEAADGTVDPKTLAPAGYDPSAGAGGFVKAVWQAYRPKADEIGAETRRRAVTEPPRN